jgi:hypothetical protein
LQAFVDDVIRAVRRAFWGFKNSVSNNLQQIQIRLRLVHPTHATTKSITFAIRYLSQDYLPNISKYRQWPFLKNSPDKKQSNLKHIFLTEGADSRAKAITDQGVHRLDQKSRSEDELRKLYLRLRSVIPNHSSECQ